MDCKSTSHNLSVRGTTVAEIVVAIGLTAIVLVTICTLYLYCTRTFISMEGLMDLENANRLAVDRISQEIRQADRLLSFSANQLVFALNGEKVAFTFYPDRRELRRETEAGSRLLLENCDFVRYEIFQRTPSNGAYGFFPTATPADCKVVRLSWMTTRHWGDQVGSQSSLRTAQVVLRNQDL